MRSIPRYSSTADSSIMRARYLHQRWSQNIWCEDHEHIQLVPEAQWRAWFACTSFSHHSWRQKTRDFYTRRSRRAAYAWTIHQDIAVESVKRRFVQADSTTRCVWHAISSYLQHLNVTEILWPVVVKPCRPLSKQLMQHLPLCVSTGQSESGQSFLFLIICPCSCQPYLAKLLCNLGWLNMSVMQVFCCIMSTWPVTWRMKTTTPDTHLSSNLWAWASHTQLTSFRKPIWLCL